MRVTLPCLTLALLFASPWALLADNGRDGDGDGLPDKVEEALGTDPSFPESLDVIVRDPTRDQGDRVGRDNYAPGLDIVAVALGNVAQDRWLWRVDFLDNVLTDNLGLIIYIQADNDPATGRKDARGIDYMLTCHAMRSAVRAFAPDGSSRQLSARAAVLGKSLYLCADLKLHQEAGKTRCSAWVLLETIQPYKMVDTVPEFQIIAQGESPRKKVRLVGDYTENENVLVTWGLDLMRSLPANPRNVRLPIQECKLHGFKYDIFTEYHMPSVRVMEGPPYTISATVPTSGRFYPAFIAYDCSGRQVYTMSINGRRLGVAVAREENNRQALFILSQPVQLKKGDTFTVELVHLEGGPRVEDLWLLADLPPIRKLPREIRYLRADAVHDPVLGEYVGRLTFVTTWPARATVEWGETPNLGRSVAETRPWNNHRIYLRGVEPARTYHYTITVVTPEGKRLTRSAKFRAAEHRPPPTRRSGQVPLTVRNPHSAAISSWPITQGVPFPQGVLGDAQHVRLVDAAGRPVPMVAEVTARWPDGSVKWLLLDFQADLPAKAEARFTLQYGPTVKASRPNQGIEINQTDEAMVIDAGTLRISLNRKRPGYLGRVWLDKNGDGKFSDAELVLGSASAESGHALVGYDDQTATSASAPASIRLLRANPLHAVVRVTTSITFARTGATFTDSYDLHVYLNCPFIRVFHTWTNSNPTDEWSDIQSWNLRTPVTTGTGARARVSGHLAAVPLAADSLILDQPFDDSYSVAVGDHKLSQGKRADGWLDVAGSEAGVTVAVRNFWQLYPKRLSVRPSPSGEHELDIGIMPRFPAGTYQISREGELEDKLFYYLKDDVYHLRQGVSKRHELLYYFRPGGSPPDQALAAASLFQQPPLATCPTAWYCRSRAWTDVLPAAPQLLGLYKKYEDTVRASLDRYLSAREAGREYGMLNFGDWWGERGRNWGNIEYDTQHAFYLQFIRSGDLDFFYTAEQACRHNMDVDVVWAHSDSARVGRVYAHCIGHTGGYYDHKVNNQGTPGGHFTVSHTWVEGYLDNYFLTGDFRALETARLVADHYASYGTVNYDYNNARTSGWHLILLLAMYRATADPYYLNAAHIVIDRVKEREMPEGGWARQMMPGHCHCIPRHRGEAAFMVGILLTGLKDYYEVTGDAATARMLVRGAKNIIKETWVPASKGMRYTSCPKTNPSPGLSALITEGILYAYSLHQDPELAEVALVGTLEGIRRVKGFGKSLSMQIRVTPHFLHQLRQLRLTELPLVLQPSSPVTLYVKPADPADFAVVLRPRGQAGKATAKLFAPNGKLVAELAASPDNPAAAIAPTEAVAAGVFRLELTGTGEWGVDSYLTPMVVDATRPITLAPAPVKRWYFLAPGSRIDARERLDMHTVGELYAAPLPAVRGLRCFAVPAGRRLTLRLDGPSTVLAPWSLLWFDPGQPTARGRLEGELGPGSSLHVTLDATASTDVDGSIRTARWSIDGRPVGEGLKLRCRLPGPGVHTIGLEVVDDAGLSSQTSFQVRVPPEWLLSADPNKAVVIEAEDFVREQGGHVRLFQRPGTSGKMISYWHAALGHTLFWRVDLPCSGYWHIGLKYCTSSTDTFRDLKVDGRHPLPALARFHLPPTGGFSTSADNWRYLLLGENSGAPIRLKLSGGPHQISMTNLGGGCGLDQLFLIPAPPPPDP